MVRRHAKEKPWALHLRQRAPVRRGGRAAHVPAHGALSSAACGLTVVMPTKGRRPKSSLLFKLLLHPLMQRETSEILISHGSQPAWQMRGDVSAAVDAMAERFNTHCASPEGSLTLELENATERRQFCDDQNVLKHEGARANAFKHLDSYVRHLDSYVGNAELGAAQRYLAAGHARNEVIV